MASSLFNLCVQAGGSDPVVGSTPDGPLRLHYFDVFGRGGLIRQSLRMGDVPFEDCRIRGQDWNSHKPSTPFGYVPVLEVGDVKLVESSAIVHYAGRLSGLMPSNPLKQAQAQSIVVALADMGTKMYHEWAQLPSGSEKENKAAYFRNDVLPTFIKNMEAYVSQTARNGYAVGSTLTVADLAIYNFLQLFTDPSAEFYLPCNFENDLRLNLPSLRASENRALQALKTANLL